MLINKHIQITHHYFNIVIFSKTTYILYIDTQKKFKRLFYIFNNTCITTNYHIHKAYIIHIYKKVTTLFNPLHKSIPGVQ